MTRSSRGWPAGARGARRGTTPTPIGVGAPQAPAESGCLAADGLISEDLTQAALRSGQVPGRNRQMRLALVSSKGGTGKTTSAVSLAMVLHRAGRTLAVDC